MRMSRAYELGFGRIVKVSDEIRIIEQASGKFVKFSPARWAVLQLNMAEINDAIEKSLLSSDFRYMSHLGGGWFCSVSSGYKCIDFRFWFVSTDDRQKRWPTKVGLALKLCEWRELKNIIGRISVDYPKLSATVPCFIDKDHFHPDIASHCLECMPIPVEGCEEFHQHVLGCLEDDM